MKSWKVKKKEELNGQEEEELFVPWRGKGAWPVEDEELKCYSEEKEIKYQWRGRAWKVTEEDNKLKGQETGRVACLSEEEAMMGQLRVGAEDQQPSSQYKRKNRRISEEEERKGQ